jgi:hypothetical protein
VLVLLILTCSDEVFESIVRRRTAVARFDSRPVERYKLQKALELAQVRELFMRESLMPRRDARLPITTD